MVIQTWYKTRYAFFFNKISQYNCITSQSIALLKTRDVGLKGFKCKIFFSKMSAEFCIFSFFFSLCLEKELIFDYNRFTTIT